jgi:hypothetical protein
VTRKATNSPPLPGVQVRVFDRTTTYFKNTYGNNPQSSQLPLVWNDANLIPVGVCVTAADGVCFAGEETTGNDLIIVKALTSTNTIFYDGKPTTPSDFDNTGIAAKSFSIP